MIGITTLPTDRLRERDNTAGIVYNSADSDPLPNSVLNRDCSNSVPGRQFPKGLLLDASTLALGAAMLAPGAEFLAISAITELVQSGIQQSMDPADLPFTCHQSPSLTTFAFRS